MRRSEIRAQVAHVVAAIREACGTNDPRPFARRVLADIPPEVLAWIAVEYLSDEVRHERRRETALVERAATRESVMQEVLGSFDKRGTGAGPGRGSKPRSGTTEREYWETCTLEGREWVRMEAEFERRRWAAMTNIVDEFVASLRTEWTQELLESTFALTDGSLVTWGDATAAQHTERFEMFTRNIAVNAEGAARHQEALLALEKTGATCLREAVQIAA